MRVAIVTPGFPPEIGGIEAVVAGLARGLAFSGVDVEVWTHRREAVTPTTELDRGVLVRSFPVTSSHRFPFSASLWRHVKTYAGDMDLLHVHSYHASAALAVSRVSADVPYVFSPHYHGGGHSFAANVLHVPYRLAGRRLVARANSIVAVSQAERDLLLRDFPDSAASMQVIHNAVDVEELGASTPFLDEPPTLLCLGRVERYKRIDRVIEAFDEWEGPGRLVIVGAGPDSDRLARIVASHRRNTDIAMLGRIPRAEVARWLRTAAVVVNMSEHEAFGIVALEAAAAGSAVVLSDIPAHREVSGLLEGSPHRLVSDASSLGEALNAIREEPRVGPRPVRDWSDVVREHRALYERVTGSA